MTQMETGQDRTDGQVVYIVFFPHLCGDETSPAHQFIQLQIFLAGRDATSCKLLVWLKLALDL